MERGTEGGTSRYDSGIDGICDIDPSLLFQRRHYCCNYIGVHFQPLPRLRHRDILYQTGVRSQSKCNYLIGGIFVAMLRNSPLGTDYQGGSYV